MALSGWIHKLLSAVALFTLLLSPVQPLADVGHRPVVRAAAGRVANPSDKAPSSGLYRTQVAVRQPADWARLERLGVTVLERGDDWALVLVDEDQLETLARLRFEPRSTDELGALVAAHAQAKPWLAAAWAGVQRSMGAGERASPQLLRSLAPELKAGLAALTSVDDDADGLTNTEEQWWCTDPLNPNSDYPEDTINDGPEVAIILDHARHLTTTLSYAPFAKWPTWGASCPDVDEDSVPDQAERFVIGTNVAQIQLGDGTLIGSTDWDRYDDGQELFGESQKRGQMTGVLPPGDSPFVAALPEIEVEIVPDSLVVERVTEIRTEKGRMTQTTVSYSTAKTEGMSTSVANTVMWNEWQEVSESLQQRLPPGGLSTLNPHLITATKGVTAVQANWNKWLTGGSKILLGIGAVAGGCAAGTALSGTIVGIPAGVLACVGSIATGLGQIGEGISILTTPDEVQRITKANQKDDQPVSSQNVNLVINQSFDTESIVRAIEGTRYAYLQTGELISQRLYEIANVLAAPVRRTTTTKGRSWGGAQTTTHTQYEEYTITNGEEFTDGEDWRTATAVDSSHAAELQFSYRIRNTGTDYASQLTNLIFNIYIGDNPNPAITCQMHSPPEGQNCNLVSLGRIEPNSTKGPYTTGRIWLNLSEMMQIDLGGPIRVVVDSYSLGGSDDKLVADALNANVLIAIEDGTDDGDELIDTYLIPTWGTETVLDVLARYFPHDTDADGNLIAIWTPEYRTDTPAWCVEPNRVGTTLWCKHALSTADWWNVYLNGLGDGSEGFQDTPAAPGSVALFRFNKDSDLDGYSDRSEFHLGTDLHDPADHPGPELIAAVHSIRVDNYVTATLSLSNIGNYDAYGIEAVMVAPDDSVTITNNTVGGSGRVGAGKQVIVGSRIMLQSPLPDPWTQSGHAVPTVGGYYTGQQDRTYTFTAQCANPDGCDVGAGTWSLAWDDGAGNNGTLNFSAGYASPTFLDVGTLGVKLALYSGKVYNGESFTVQALTPRDTFQYTINREPYTEPIVVVSYNDPQGNHRFVIPPEAMALSHPTDDLTTYSGQMLPNVGVDIVTTAEFNPGANTTNLVINNPTEVTLADAHLFLEFIDPEGMVVSEVPVTVTLPAGPTVVPVTWDTADFDPPYDPDQDYIVMAFWTDYQGNILDTAARPLSSFGLDPQPQLVVWPLSWEGHTFEGLNTSRTFRVLNPGDVPLRVMVEADDGLSLSGHAEFQSNRSGLIQVDPDSSVDFVVTYDTASLGQGHSAQAGPAATGTIAPSQRAVRLLSNDLQATTVEINADLAITPKRVQISDTEREWEKSVRICGDYAAGTRIRLGHTITEEPETFFPAYLYDPDDVLLGVGREIDSENGIMDRARDDSASIDLTLSHAITDCQEYLLLLGKDLVFESSGSMTVTKRLPKYITVTTATFQVVGSSDSPTFTVDVGNDSVIDDSFSGNLSTPITSVNLSSAINTYLAGHAADSDGFIQVPFVFAADASGTIGVFNFDIQYIPWLPDLTLSPSDIQISNPNPTKGEIITVSATVHNVAEAYAHDVEVALFKGDPEDTGVLVARDLIEKIAPLGSAEAELRWVPRHAGSVDVFVKIDPSDVISETNETNNQAGISLNIGHGSGSIVMWSEANNQVKVYDPAGTQLASIDVPQGGEHQEYTACSMYGARGWAYGLSGGIASGDVDGDGMNEVVMWSEVNNQIKVYDLDGTELATVSVPQGGEHDVREDTMHGRWAWAYGLSGGIAVGDIDGDGVDEIVMWSEVNNEVKVYDLDGTELATVSVPQGGEHNEFVRTQGQWSCAWAYGLSGDIAIGDVDGDGVDEIVMWSEANNQVKVYDLDGTELATFNVLQGGEHDEDHDDLQARWAWAYGLSGGIASGDVNGDGVDEIIVWSEANDQVRVYDLGGTELASLSVSQGGEHYEYVGYLSESYYAYAYGLSGGIAASDMDGDRVDEIVMWSEANDQLMVYEVDGTQNMTITVPQGGEHDEYDCGCGAWGCAWAYGLSGGISGGFFDCLPPDISNLATFPSVFSPDGDSIDETVSINLVLTDDMTAPMVYSITIEGLTTTVKMISGSGAGQITETWDGIGSGGTVVPNGVYTISVNATDEFGCEALERRTTVTVNKLDLSVSSEDVLWSPCDPSSGDPVTISAIVHNSGDNSLADVRVQFFDGDPASGGYQIGVDQLITVPAKGFGVAQVHWDTTGLHDTHDLYVRVDPLNAFTEADETNNQALRSLEFLPLPDLVISPTDIAFEPAEPTAGEQVVITATVHKAGLKAVGAFIVTFYDGDPSSGGVRIGSDVIEDMTMTNTASVVWTAETQTGDNTIYVAIDRSNAIPEVNETNNLASRPLRIKTKPDLRVTAVELSDDEPVVGETVTVQVTLRNDGQTDAGASTLALYDGNPESGGTLLDEGTVAVGGESQTTLDFTWTPTAPGSHRLFAVSDRDDAISEFDEGNNQTWQDVYVGFAGPLLLDSGTVSDVEYTPEQGYGYVDEGQADILGDCGSEPYQTYRLDPDGRVVYRFDHLLPGHFYHLDLTLYECGQGAGRQEVVKVDGITVAGPEDLGDGEVHRLSILLDPALYADRAISVTVEAYEGLGALVNEISLHDVDYRYADSDTVNDPQYPTGDPPYGWLDGSSTSAWGSLPYQTARVDLLDNNVRYQFDGLDPLKRYRVHLSFYQGSGTNRVQQVWIDGQPTGEELTIVSGQRYSTTVSVPLSAYADGSIVVSVVRTNASVGAMVNEIALEEETQISAATCQVTETPYWIIAYGSVTIAGQPAPPGTVVTAESPRGDVVGCFVVKQDTPGLYGFMPIYGEDLSANPPIPGMRDGETVIFRVNGALAVPDPSLEWHDDKSPHRVDLEAGITQAQSLLLTPGWNLISFYVEPPVPLVDTVLRSIAGKYCLVLGERDIYDCSVPERFRSLKELHGGLGYYLRLEGGASANLLVEGVPIPPTTPIPLHLGWNWVGYLPRASQPVAEALQSIDGHYLWVTDGSRFYDPALPDFSTLTDMEPDIGYLIYASDAVTLTYPAGGGATAGLTSAALTGLCSEVAPTPYFTLLYGSLTLNGAPAPVGTRVEVITPRGEVAGCFIVDEAGRYGFMPVYGEDGGDPPIPGFREGEPLILRVNGWLVESAAAPTWTDDKLPHRVDLAVTVPYRLYLPLMLR
jgi:subtilase family serine protease